MPKATQYTNRKHWFKHSTRMASQKMRSFRPSLRTMLILAFANALWQMTVEPGAAAETRFFQR